MKYKELECSDNITKKLLSNFKQKDLKEKIFIKIKNQSIVARTTEQLVKNNTLRNFSRIRNRLRFACFITIFVFTIVHC